MATTELTLSNGPAANLLVALNAVERLAVLSQSILEGVDEGEAYETLCRRLRTLHRNILEISEMAVAAKTNPTKETA